MNPSRINKSNALNSMVDKNMDMVESTEEEADNNSSSYDNQSNCSVHKINSLRVNRRARSYSSGVSLRVNCNNNNINMDNSQRIQCTGVKFSRPKTKSLSSSVRYTSVMMTNNSNNNHNAPPVNSMRKQKQKILILIATVSITFALTWLPAHVIQIWKVAFNSSFPYNDTMYIVKVISHTLSYSNSLLNPFIYVFIGTKFRNHIYSEFRGVCKFFCRKKKGSNTPKSSTETRSRINGSCGQILIEKTDPKLIKTKTKVMNLSTKFYNDSNSTMF